MFTNRDYFFIFCFDYVCKMRRQKIVKRKVYIKPTGEAARRTLSERERESARGAVVRSPLKFLLGVEVAKPRAAWFLSLWRAYYPQSRGI